MILTRLDTNESLSLPQDLHWKDEFEWHAVAQSTPEYTLSGSLIIQQGVKQAGRPITLSGEWAWLDLKTIRTLSSWCDEPELKLQLTHYDGRVFQVAFRLHEGGLAQISPVCYSTPEIDTDRYTAEIRLMTI